MKAVDGNWSTTAIFTLRPDARWADGVDMTADDMAFTWDVLTKTGRGLVDSDLGLTHIRAVRVVGVRQFEIIYDGIVCQSDLNMPPLLPSHLERAIWQADASHYFENSLYIRHPETLGLYSGPYVVSRIETGELHFSRNPYWPATTPFFSSVNLHVVQTPAELETLVRAGKVDVFSTLVFDMGQKLAHELGSRYQAFYAPSEFLAHLRINFDNPILKDLRVRQALLLGLNRDGLVKSVLDNKGTVAQSLLSPFMPGYSVVTRYPYNPLRAGQLLDDAGWRLGKGAIRYNSLGAPLQFELRYRPNFPWAALAPQLEAAWKALGVGVKLQVDSQLSADVADARDRYSGMVGFSQSLEGGLETARFWFHSSMIPSAANNWRGNNIFGVSIGALDIAMDGLTLAGCSVEPRQQALAAVQKAYADNLPALPLWFGTVITLADKRLDGAVDARNFSPAPAEYWRFRF
nr:ABC transporter substrate-binding protein [Nitrospirillum iridis]